MLICFFLLRSSFLCLIFLFKFLHQETISARRSPADLSSVPVFSVAILFLLVGSPACPDKYPALSAHFIGYCTFQSTKMAMKNFHVDSFTYCKCRFFQIGPLLCLAETR